MVPRQNIQNKMSGLEIMAPEDAWKLTKAEIDLSKLTIEMQGDEKKSVSFADWVDQSSLEELDIAYETFAKNKLQASSFSVLKLTRSAAKEMKEREFVIHLLTNMMEAIDTKREQIEKVNNPYVSSL